MNQDTITIRIDSETKALAKESCAFLGTTVTAVASTALIDTINRANYIQRLIESAQNHKDVGFSFSLLSDEERQILIAYLQGG